MIKKGGYSKLIRPILFILDLCIVSFFAWGLLTTKISDIIFFVGFWLILSFSFSFYSVYRFTKVTKIISLLSKQVSVFILLIFSYLYIKDKNIAIIDVFKFLFCLYFGFIIWRVFIHIILKKYRIITGSNYRRVVIIGANDSAKKLEFFFNNEPGFGYKFIGFFTDEVDNHSSKGTVSQSYDFIIKNNIDEVYCALGELSDIQIKHFIEFCDINVKTIKFIPDNKGLYSKNFYLDYYDITPILSLRKFPLDDHFNNVIKRVFDIVFALFIICFVLSWLIPILGLFIVIESKGPIFFQQNRPGIKEKGFGCYKFRSMTINSRSEDSATRNDARITKVGRFIRKTSIDELPQFINVLFGSMSVVGPRPHLWRQNEIYRPKISKYMVRHFVKPGVTGLAQVRGYRGEIETNEDIINRTKYDIFYIENWSLLLDLNIVIQTILNVFRGDDKAY
ncbi:exopolysaccharide biosynthesis polyprenyl glycosylphosphotransferase [Seonamhaeicola sp. MEBiC1930]|uniref:exopolysaccharide biosynthesis polyprenyl glycosylphosphotransferase n=1 Tax=Seonamhaeicola sp. MEBiC01930 TaxID=2976768 RepID=UPI0032513EE5